MTSSLERSSSVRLTAPGRRTGRPHSVVIWFAHQGGYLYFLAHARSHGRGTDWYQNFVAAKEALIEATQEGCRVRLDTFDDPQQAVEVTLRLFRHKCGGVVDEWYVPDRRIAVKARIVPS